MSPSSFLRKKLQLMLVILAVRHCIQQRNRRVLLDKGRKLAQQYFMTYREHMPTRMLVRELANVMQEYTQRG